MKESTKETTGQTQEETTSRKQLTGAAVYFEDKKSVFNTLPSFTAGKFEEYFSESYVEGLKFSGAKESDYSDYLKQLGVSKKTAHKALREALYAQADCSRLAEK